MRSHPRASGAVRVANGQGFWGDSALGVMQLVEDADIDYLTMDYLAEVTMSILQKMRSRDPAAGYATDFVSLLERILPRCREQGIRIIANAGGVNPEACAQAVMEVIRRAGLAGITVATVTGDDLLHDLDRLLEGGQDLANLSTGEPLLKHRSAVRCANAYLGAAPIVEALAAGADIVITGRVADASLTVAPLVHEFGWSLEDFDLLAAATVAGHIIECGTQCTGGNFDGWRDIPRMAEIGYPIVEAFSDGAFVITKKQGTGGRVDTDTVTAQLLYEIADPKRYLTPDVIADFSTIRLVPDGPDRVRIDGIKGSAPTTSYKVSVGLSRGFRISCQLTVAGPDAVEKANFAAEILFARLRAADITFAPHDCLVETIGANVLGTASPAAPEPSEVTLRISVRDPRRRALEHLGSELAALLTSGPPGLTGFAGGRPKPSEVVAFWPALVARECATARVTLFSETK